MQDEIERSGYITLGALKISGSERYSSEERVAEEVAVALSYNGVSHAVMMATPCDLDDFALGFSLTEGIIEKASDMLDIEQYHDANGIRLELRITERRMAVLSAVRRSLTGRTGCGLCGAESLASAIRPVRRVAKQSLSSQQIERGFAMLAAGQTLNRATGAAHAAAYVWASGCLLREDIGRHNAVDKLIGAMSKQIERPAGFLAVSSRASYEIVHKAATAGIAVVAAISAPTSLAIQVAREAGVCLVGFARGDRMTFYTD